MQAIRATLALLALFLGGCETSQVAFPVTSQAQRNALPADINVVQLTDQNIHQFGPAPTTAAPTTLPDSGGWTYAIGVGDIVTVIVFDHPELTLPAGSSSGAAGFRVGSDGAFTYPYIGRVEAIGRTPQSIRTTIARRLANFIPDPQVDVRVTKFDSQSIVVAGEVNAPNRQPLTSVPLRLIEAVNAAGGFEDSADLRRVVVQRGGRSYRVNLAAFLQTGSAANNPILRNGDVVNVPRRESEEAYLLGEVARADVVNLSNDTVNLTQAISRQGGVRGVRADARGIFVFRRVAGVMTVYQLDISIATGLLLGTQFILQPDDVIYIVRAPLTRWNDTISRLLPSVSATTAVDRASNVLTN